MEFQANVRRSSASPAKRKMGLFVAVATVAGTLLWSGSPAVARGSSSPVEHARWHSTFVPGDQQAGNPEIGPSLEIPGHQPHAKTLRHTAAAGVPEVTGTALTASQLPGFAGFNGLSHRDQRLAGTGAYTNTQFSLEPPDQGLCVSGGRIVEAVNNAMQVFDTAGSALTAPIALSQFFGLKPEVDRTNPNAPVFGDFVSDPRCYFDPGTQRWFLTELQIDVDPVTGDFGKHSHLVIAASTTSEPTATWNIYLLDITNDGTNGTPSHAGCPCFGDQPLIGADANGFYVSTNEYALDTFAFHGAQIYAFSKTGLESGANTAAVHIDAGPMLLSFGGLAYSVQPATTPAGHDETANNGTEYFLSGLDFGVAPALGTRETRLAVWALTNTATLTGATPAVSLTNTVIDTELYAQPPNATQKAGPTPLADLVHSPLELLSANEDRLQQVVFAAGHLWAAQETAVKLPNGATLVGAAYFVITPSDPHGTLSATVARQGYIAVDGANMLFPAIGVTDAGKAAIVFTLVGPAMFPSAAYVPVDLTSGAGAVRIAAAGALPDDGFSGYRAFGFDGVGRWGDYSAAVADTSGTIWMATEYIPNAPRTQLANWGTFVSRVTP
jgi:hypothetical protein